MKSGDKSLSDNREFKHAMGASANSVANKFFAEARGKHLTVDHMDGHAEFTGVLEAFDLYSLLFDGDEFGPALLLKGSGLLFRYYDYYDEENGTV